MIGFLIYLNGILLSDGDCTIDSTGHFLLFPYKINPLSDIQVHEYVTGILIRRIVFKTSHLYGPNERISYEAFLPTAKH